jgi:hypothetical protein
MKMTQNEKACVAWRKHVEDFGEGFLLMRWTRARRVIVEASGGEAPRYRISGSGYDKADHVLADFLSATDGEVYSLKRTGALRQVLWGERMEVWHYRVASRA